MTDSGIDGIVCFSTDAWGDMKRPAQLMRCLSKRAPVLYVEPYLSLTSLLKNAPGAVRGPASIRARRGATRAIEEVADNIHVITSLIAIPPQRIPLVSAGGVERVARSYHAAAWDRALRAAGRLGMSSPLVWVTYPTWMPEPLAIPGATLAYDCMDRWADFPDALADPRWSAAVGAYERRLLARSDIVFCSAEGLFDTHNGVGSGRVTLVRNGADVKHFEPTGREVPADIAALPRPIIGYMGAVAGWVDFELIRSVALARPEWSIVLIGPVFEGRTTGDAGALKLVSELPNVHVMGRRPYADVPAYVEAFDVATIPFALNGLTADTNPIKVYEYLAAGVPVVSTPLREVEGMPHVRTAAAADEFVRATEPAIAERHVPGLVAERIALAEQNSWEARAQLIWDAVGAL